MGRNDGKAAVDSCASFSLFDPHHRAHRYLILVFLVLSNFASYYVYDNPVALEDTIINVMRIDVTQYSLFYSLYAWPNVVLAFCGGYLIDRVFGVRLSTVFFSSFVCLGQLIFALGAFVDHYWLMLVGRFVFGIGGESLTVAVNTYAVLWYKGKELNMVFGLLLAIPGLGGALNMAVNSKLYDNAFSFVSSNHIRLGTVLMVGFGLCIVSLLFAILLGFLDKRAEQILERNKKDSGEQIRCRDIKDFPFSLWLVFSINLTYYSTFYTFNGEALLFFLDKYRFSTSKANFVNSLVYFLPAVVTPFAGIILDKVGFNLLWVNFGIIIAVVGHSMLAFLGFSVILPYMAALVRALAFSVIACSLWPLVAYLVPEHQLGTAYGMMQSFQNIGLAVVSIIAGVIVDELGFLMLELFFLLLLSVTLNAGILLYLVDSTTANKLNLSAWRRAKSGQEDMQNQDTDLKDEVEEDNGSGQFSCSNPIASSPAFHRRNRQPDGSTSDCMDSHNHITDMQPGHGIPT